MPLWVPSSQRLILWLSLICGLIGLILLGRWWFMGGFLEALPVWPLAFLGGIGGVCFAISGNLEGYDIRGIMFDTMPSEQARSPQTLGKNLNFIWTVRYTDLNSRTVSVRVQVQEVFRHEGELWIKGLVGRSRQPAYLNSRRLSRIYDHTLQRRAAEYDIAAWVRDRVQGWS